MGVSEEEEEDGTEAREVMAERPAERCDISGILSQSGRQRPRC